MQTTAELAKMWCKVVNKGNIFCVAFQIAKILSCIWWDARSFWPRDREYVFCLVILCGACNAILHPVHPLCGLIGKNVSRCSFQLPFLWALRKSSEICSKSLYADYNLKLELFKFISSKSFKSWRTLSLLKSSDMWLTAEQYWIK